MKKNITIIGIVLLVCSAWLGTAAAQTGATPPVAIAPPAITSETYARARVMEILEEGEKNIDGNLLPYQKISVIIASGAEKGKTVIIEHGSLFAIQEHQRVKRGETIVIAKPGDSPKDDFYYVIDTYRTNCLFVIIGIFLLAALYWARGKGITSLLGLGVSILALFYWIIPKIISGTNPFTTAILGAVLILVVSLYLSHGFNRRTSVALASSLASLGLAILLSFVFVRLARLTGSGTEEAFYLQLGATPIDLRGVLMAGIIIGTLGILDDITTAQSAAVQEISRANPALGFGELYRRGLSVGREHIASLINTLVLAYAGVSFPLLLLFAMQKNNQPLWLVFNSGFIAEEIVRTLIGSLSLIAAVPLTTVLAALVFSRQPNH